MLENSRQERDEKHGHELSSHSSGGDEKGDGKLDSLRVPSDADYRGEGAKEHAPDPKESGGHPASDLKAESRQDRGESKETTSSDRRPEAKEVNRDQDGPKQAHDRPADDLKSGKAGGEGRGDNDKKSASEYDLAKEKFGESTRRAADVHEERRRQAAAG